MAETESLDRAGIKILPTDIVNVLFRCKLLFASRTEQEYRQRCGGSFFENRALFPNWSDRSENIDVLTDRYITRLEAEIKERTLLTYISSFTSARPGENLQGFFSDLFAKLGVPFVCFFEGDHLVELYKKHEPGLRSYDLGEAKQYFCSPSIGFKSLGSQAYCLSYSSTWLRTFLNMLRIGSYICARYRDFGRDVKMTAPTYPVFLGARAQGCYCWSEDRKESWTKIPDGCLFLSFGYRGLSDMWLDFRTFPTIEKFMLGHRKIFEHLKNPWDASSINDIAPALDILSSATQIPDLGAKILLVYCCLEHLFVPKDAYTENKKYIIGGMNALAPYLLPWFGNLYNLRCAYAHKGFVLRDDETMALVTESMKNAMILTVAKLSVS